MKEMVTHSSVLAWKSHGQRSLGGGYSPWGLKRVGHDLVTKPSPSHFNKLGGQESYRLKGGTLESSLDLPTMPLPCQTDKV